MDKYVKRFEKIQEIMKRDKMDVNVISDLTSIKYLIDREVAHVGERLLVLAVPSEGKSVLFVNRLFPIEPGDNFDIVYHDDTDVATEGLAGFLPENGTVGIDGFLYSQFLIQLMEQKAARYINGSYIVNSIRAIKDESERELMRKASLLNDEVIAKVPSLLKEGMSEIELAELLIAEYKKVGNPWEPLVCFGSGAAEPHHVNGETRLKAGDLVLVDAGQETDGYNSDMTRTFFYKGITEEQRKVYEIVKEANRRGKEAVKPGVRFCDIDRAAREYITEQGYGEYFTHRLGHNIGMSIHEEPSVSSANEQIVQEGMAFSIEPGIYLPGKFGVRIEDLVIVTEDGCECLNYYPRDIQIIE